MKRKRWTWMTAAMGMVLAGSAHADALVDRGQDIADTYCDTCHATKAEDESPFEGAPPFRDLHKRYPVEHLEEALAEGLTSGHEAMPTFIFAPEDVDAFIAYLQEFERAAD
jgi:mono/diheme cytochrome c family protein